MQKSPHKFSLIGKDQSHEQSNKSLQSHGGAVVLYEIPETLTLFMLAGPDCSRCVDTARSSLFITKKPTVYTLGNRKDVLSFVETVEQFGNLSGPVMSLSHLTHKLLWSRMSSDLLVGSTNLAKSFMQMHNKLHRQSIK